MDEYLVDKRDVDFCLFEHNDIEYLLSYEKYAAFDKEMLKHTVDEILKQVKNELAPLNSFGDRQGVTLKDGAIELPKEIVKAYKFFAGTGIIGVSSQKDWGGQELPELIYFIGAEFFNGSNCAVCNIFGLTTGAANVIAEFGSNELKICFLKNMYSGKWTGTMCLTEEQAGSALADITCKATKEGIAYKIVGNKNYVSGGDQNFTENIVHLVLARTEDAPKGIKGLSLFAVPKMKINEDGSLGENNDVNIIGIMEKMGFRASPTCIINFGDNNDCTGYLIGEECKGIHYMFHMMNESRLLIGLQGLGIAGSAYRHAMRYTKERIQGTEITQMKDPDAPRVPIVTHPDVRRMLLAMKSITEGMRALIYKAAYYKSCGDVETDIEKKNYYLGFADLLTPICKAWSSDMGFHVTELAMQCLGGYGYCTDYPIEQYMRDVKVSSIFEGTNGIQALDLLARKVPAQNGRLYMNFIAMVNDFIEKHRNNKSVGDNILHLERAKGVLVDITSAFGNMLGKGNVLYPVLQATPYLELFGDVAIAHLLIEQSVIAHEKLNGIYIENKVIDKEEKVLLYENNTEAQFYWGKICSADYFVTQILPRVDAKGRALMSNNTSALDIIF